MKNLLIIIALCCASAVNAKSTTVLISIDGFANHYFEQYPLPYLKSLRQSGASSKGMYPVYPSKTFPNHVSIVTGVYPSQHGIFHNKFFHKNIGEDYYLGAGNKDERWLTAKPIWTIAEEQNKKAFLYFWPESESISYSIKASHIESYEHNRPNSERVDSVVSWICSSANERPDFISLYFSTVDSAGHEHGQKSPELMSALLELDNQLQRLISQSSECGSHKTNFVIVSDHGMTKSGKENVMVLDDIFHNVTSKIVNGQTQLFIYEAEQSKLKRLREQLQQYADQSALKRFQVFNKSNYPEHWHIDNTKAFIPDIIVDAIAPFTFAEKNEKVSVETHGYDAQYNDQLQAIFIGYGPAFIKASKIDAFDNIHIAALLAKLLDISLPDNVESNIEIFTPILKKNMNEN